MNDDSNNCKRVGNAKTKSWQDKHKYVAKSAPIEGQDRHRDQHIDKIPAHYKLGMHASLDLGIHAWYPRFLLHYKFHQVENLEYACLLGSCPIKSL